MRCRSPLHQTSPAAPRPFQRTPSASGKQCKGWTAMSAQHRLRATKIPANSASEYPREQTSYPPAVSCAPLPTSSSLVPPVLASTSPTPPCTASPIHPYFPSTHPASHHVELYLEHQRPSTVVDCGVPSTKPNLLSLRNRRTLHTLTYQQSSQPTNHSSQSTHVCTLRYPHNLPKLSLPPSCLGTIRIAPHLSRPFGPPSLRM
ncbi:uncharacterized protein BKA78DRAFT_112174 [Phyllosticta capitalensis]|uniref:uncharacterized protein n=1 Tax=Phyllosticta capitalensis TaxID=121624 RepID=UPI00312F5C12